MLHLTFEEISDFVSMKDLSAENGALASKVLTHVRACDDCRALLGSMLDISDIFTKAKLSLDAENKHVEIEK